MLKCSSENMTRCHKVSIKGQGQGHRNKKLAQNVFLFSQFKGFDPKYFVRLYLYLVFIDTTTMPFKLKKKNKQTNTLFLPNTFKVNVKVT